MLLWDARFMNYEIWRSVSGVGGAMERERPEVRSDPLFFALCSVASALTLRHLPRQLTLSRTATCQCHTAPRTLCATHTLALIKKIIL